MLKDFQGFSKARIEKLKPVVEFVEAYIGRKKVREKMLHDLQGFSNIDIKTLQDKEKQWGNEKMRHNLNRYSLQNLLNHELWDSYQTDDFLKPGNLFKIDLQAL